MVKSRAKYTSENISDSVDGNFTSTRIALNIEDTSNNKSCQNLIFGVGHENSDLIAGSMCLKRSLMAHGWKVWRESLCHWAINHLLKYLKSSRVDGWIHPYEVCVGVWLWERDGKETDTYVAQLPDFSRGALFGFFTREELNLIPKVNIRHEGRM